jgi:putative glutamine amidotransferase
VQPLIGITMSFDNYKNNANVSEKYFRAIEQAGGLPLAIPPFKDKATLKALAERLDGVILSGGPDIDPSYFHEIPHPRLGNVCPRRDEAEIFMAGEIIRLSKPLLGICRGMQVMNVVMGGNLYQDIPSEIKKPLKHIQDAPRWHKSHEIEIIQEDSLLFKIIGQRRIKVNSFHHQSVKEPALCYKITATAPDGVVEAMESRQKGVLCLGVQWHPEDLTDDPAHLRLFQVMIDAAKRRPEN